MLQTQYAQIIGSLMFLMNNSRPSIDYDVNKLIRYTHNPNRDHWIALCRVMKCLWHTIDFGLCYGEYPDLLEGYFNTN